MMADLPKGKFYLGRDGKAIRQITLTAQEQVVAYREFGTWEMALGHPRALAHRPTLWLYNRVLAT